MTGWRVSWRGDDGEAHDAVIEDAAALAAFTELAPEVQIERLTSDPAEVAGELFDKPKPRRVVHALVGGPPAISAHGFSKELVYHHNEEHDRVCEPDDTEPGPVQRFCPCRRTVAACCRRCKQAISLTARPGGLCGCARAALNGDSRFAGWTEGAR